MLNSQSKGLLCPHAGLYQRLALFPLVPQVGESCLVGSQCLRGIRRLTGNVDLVYIVLEFFKLRWRTWRADWWLSQFFQVGDQAKRVERNDGRCLTYVVHNEIVFAAWTETFEMVECQPEMSKEFGLRVVWSMSDTVP